MSGKFVLIAIAVALAGGCGGSESTGDSGEDPAFAPPSEFTLGSPAAVSGYLVGSTEKFPPGAFWETALPNWHIFVLDDRSRVVRMAGELGARYWPTDVPTAVGFDGVAAYFVSSDGGQYGEQSLVRYSRINDQTVPFIAHEEGVTYQHPYLRDDRTLAWAEFSRDTDGRTRPQPYIADPLAPGTKNPLISVMGDGSQFRAFDVSDDGYLVAWAEFDEVAGRLVIFAAPTGDLSAGSVLYEFDGDVRGTDVRVSDQMRFSFRFIGSTHVYFRSAVSTTATGHQSRKILVAVDDPGVPISLDGPIDAGYEQVSIDFHKLANGGHALVAEAVSDAGDESSQREALWIATTANPGDLRRVTPDFRPGIRESAISPDGRWLAFTDGDAHAERRLLHLTEIERGEPNAIVIEEIDGRHRQAISFTDDGVLTYLSGDQLFSMRPDHSLEPILNAVISSDWDVDEIQNLLDGRILLRANQRFYIGPSGAPGFFRPLLDRTPTKHWQEWWFVPVP